MERVVLYDGVCNLCDGAVRFILPRDPQGRFSFASLQSPFGRSMMLQYGINPGGDPESIILVEGSQVFLESTAMLRILSRLVFPWNLLAVFRVIPPGIRDGIYRFIARNRYRWFGKQDSCLLPQPEWRDRFLD